MSDPKHLAAPAGRHADPVGRSLPAYEPPTLVEVGTLRDLTAGGSFNDPT